MKLFPKLLVVVIFFTCSATQCNKDDEISATSNRIEAINMTGFESFNVNNEKEFPYVTTDSVKKEAYLLGIKLTTDLPYDKKYTNINGLLEKKIFCNHAFDLQTPAGSNISAYFKPAVYLPQEINDGFVLLKYPKAGLHSFKVVFYLKDGRTYESNTSLIKLY